MTGDVRLTSRFLHSGDFRIELLHFNRPAAFGAPSMPRNQLGLTHLSFSVDDIDAPALRAVEHGGAIVSGTRSTPAGRVHIIFLAAPDGTRIELMKHPAGVSWPWF
jgi:predicted enzyme related to lactoylglutathione lyase